MKVGFICPVPLCSSFINRSHISVLCTSPAFPPLYCLADISSPVQVKYNDFSGSWTPASNHGGPSSVPCSPGGNCGGRSASFPRILRFYPLSPTYQPARCYKRCLYLMVYPAEYVKFMKFVLAFVMKSVMYLRNPWDPIR